MFQVEEKSPGEKNDSAVSISHRRTSEMPIRLPVSSEEKVSNAADERLANSDRPSTLSNQKKIGAVNVEEEFRRDLKERMERAGMYLHSCCLNLLACFWRSKILLRQPN